ncbi:hypothetical protein WN943_015421 [Citrus x changshan-huyou]
MGASRGPRLSGLQKQVLSLYRGFLRAARCKSAEDRRQIESIVSAEFRQNSNQVDRKNFLYIEYLLRRAEPSPNTSMPIPKQSTRGSTSRKAPTTNEAAETKEASGISRAKERRRNASTARNVAFDQLSVPPIRGIEIREGGKFNGATPQSSAIQTNRDLKGKTMA